MINFVVATGSRWRRSGTVRFHTLSLPQKTGMPIFATGGEGDCNTCHQDNMVTKQRRMRLLSISTFNCFEWAEYWLLWKKIAASCYNRNQTWLCVYCIRHYIRINWFIITLLSNVISLFIASQRVVTYHPPFCSIVQLFLNTWCLIIWLSEHRIFGLNFVQNAHWCVTD